MRLIDADALLEEMVGITDGWLKPPKDWKWYEDSVRNAPTVGGWISVKDRLPEQSPSLFSIFKDTDKWSKAMWVMDSETVLVIVAAKGESIVTTGKLQDGKWCTRISPVIEYKVTHWMPLPKPPKAVSE